VSPWRPPADGFERQLRPDPRERRRRPLTRRQILVVRLIWVLAGIFCVSVFSLGLPARSLWQHEAVSLPVTLIVGLIWFTPRQLGQLLGLRKRDGGA
jgi:hypothetical protein